MHTLQGLISVALTGRGSSFCVVCCKDVAPTELVSASFPISADALVFEGAPGDGPACRPMLLAKEEVCLAPVKNSLSDGVRKGGFGEGDALHVRDRVFREIGQDVAGWGLDGESTT